MQPTNRTTFVLVVVRSHIAVDGLDVSVLQKFMCFIHIRKVFIT